MCKWCDEGGEYCQDCGCIICEDFEGDTGDDSVRAPYVTSSGDLYCWTCGQSNQRDIDRMEAEEAEEWGWMNFDPYDDPREDEE